MPDRSDLGDAAIVFQKMHDGVGAGTKAGCWLLRPLSVKGDEADNHSGPRTLLHTIVPMAAFVIHPGVLARSSAGPFVVVGGAFVIAGGLLSAAMARAASYHSSWTVAYVVLVAGVAQAVLGLAQAGLTDGDVSRRISGAELFGWNLGNAAVVAGTLLDVKPLLYAGAALLVATLVLVLYAIRHARPGWPLLTTRIIVALLLVSMPIGIVLQAVGH